MDVTYRSKGCLDIFASVLSLGLLPLMLWLQRQRMPAQLTDELMILHNGTQIPWSAYTKATATKVFLNRRYIGTRFVFTHPSGKVELPTDRVEQPQVVTDFILRHLPPHLLKS
jgi:hypothetical protein